jgi:NADH-quinone oxidoreductase subunit H
MDFFWTYLWPVIVIVAESVLLLVVLLVAIAYVLLADRKIWAAVQMRRGPNVVGPWGLFQSFADLLKFVLKEPVIPAGANKGVFLLAPLVTCVLALAAWAVIPFNVGWVIADINVGVLYIFAISSLMVYGVIMAGWASNSRYAFLGGLRSASQMVSYEVSMGLVIVCVLLCTGSLNLTDIVTAPRPWWMQIMLLPMLVVFLVSILAETNRAPFDLPEGESELSGGFMVEYSAMTFALFFLGEYANMILMSGMTTILFLGGWLPPFGIGALAFVPGVVWFVLKVCAVLFFFIWARATFPRYRYDQLMRLGWKVFLPLTLVWVVLISGVLVALNAVPGS